MRLLDVLFGSRDRARRLALAEKAYKERPNASALFAENDQAMADFNAAVEALLRATEDVGSSIRPAPTEPYDPEGSE